jgi:prepilin peptidase CpaA
MALAALLVFAGIEDARKREIANWKNAAIALMAPLWWVAIGIDPWPTMAILAGGALIAFALFCGAFALGQMGGGDVKLIGALALWLAPFALVQMLIAMALLGGVLTIAFVLDHRIMRRSGAIEIPYGVAIAIAGLLALREPLVNQFA